MLVRRVGRIGPGCVELDSRRYSLFRPVQTWLPTPRGPMSVLNTGLNAATVAVPFCPLGGGVPKQRLGRSRLRVDDLLYDYTVTTIRHNLAMNAVRIRLYR